MQFKTLAFLSILSILFFTGCDSKDKNEENKEVKIEKTDRKGEFQLKTIDNTLIDIRLENDRIILKDYPNKLFY